MQSRTDCRIVVTLLPTGERIELSQNLGPHSQSCSIDSDRLAQAAVHLHNGIAAGSDLVVVNRFGKPEPEATASSTKWRRPSRRTCRS
ncbi:MAG TPA: DUF2478 domain-containing protein [Beijerinckiaceae bacterium]|nr:DUF2478 domain-containing protein [Beijerinckiaceae bacterium]